MDFTIPFTQTKITIGKDKNETDTRGLVYGAVSKDPERDMRGYKIDTFGLFSAWRNNGDVYSCVNKITNSACIGGYRFINPSDPKREEVADLKYQKQVMDIICYYYGSFRKFKQAVFQQRLISGNCYIEKVRNLGGELIGLKVLDSRTISIIVDKTGAVFRYVQVMSQNGAQLLGQLENPVSVSEVAISDPVIFEPDDIIHWTYGIDPNAENFGLSPLEPVLWEVRTDLSAMISNYFFFENDAVPSVQYILKDDLQAEDKKAIKEFVEKNFKGAKNRHKASVLEGVADVKVIRVSQKDMEYLAGRQFSTEKICAAYGVPKGVLGYIKDTTFDNMAGSVKEFYEGTVRGHELDFEEMIVSEVITDASLKAGSKQMSEVITFVVSTASFDTQEAIHLRAVSQKESGIITTNEARRMIGHDPRDGEAMADALVLGSGNMATLLEDVGTDPYDPEQQLDNLQKSVTAVEKYARHDVRKTVSKHGL
jgi:HK97 family phage portal protein